MASREEACVQWVIGPSQTHVVSPAKIELAKALGFKPGHGPVPATERLLRDKASEPLFAVHGRIAAKAATFERATSIMHSLGGALRLLSTEHASLRLGRVNEAAAEQTI